MTQENETIVQESSKYPYEYLAAQITFANKIASLQSITFIDSITSYTSLQSELTDRNNTKNSDKNAWEEIFKRAENATLDEISGTAYRLFQSLPHSRFDPNWTPSFTTRFGALGVDTHPYNLDPRRNQVKLHFLPTRKNGSDLSSSKTEERKEDMKALLKWVRTNHPGVRNITSFTWLQNIPNYRVLFPQSFLERLVIKKDKFGGLWGQFVKWDGSSNTEVFKQFVQNLDEARTLEEAVDAFPFKVLGAEGSISEFYEMYGIK